MKCSQSVLPIAVWKYISGIENNADVLIVKQMKQEQNQLKYIKYTVFWGCTFPVFGFLNDDTFLQHPGIKALKAVVFTLGIIQCSVLWHFIAQ